MRLSMRSIPSFEQSMIHTVVTTQKRRYKNYETHAHSWLPTMNGSGSSPVYPSWPCVPPCGGGALTINSKHTILEHGLPPTGREPARDWSKDKTRSQSTGLLGALSAS